MNQVKQFLVYIDAIVFMSPEITCYLVVGIGIQIFGISSHVFESFTWLYIHVHVNV